MQHTAHALRGVASATAPARRSTRRPVRRRWGSFEAPTLEFTYEPAVDELRAPDPVAEIEPEPEVVLEETPPEKSAHDDIPEPNPPSPGKHRFDPKANPGHGV